jgi:hypothetical protein
MDIKFTFTPMIIMFKTLMPNQNSRRGGEEGERGGMSPNPSALGGGGGGEGGPDYKRAGTEYIFLSVGGWRQRFEL